MFAPQSVNFSFSLVFNQKFCVHVLVALLQWFRDALTIESCLFPGACGPWAGDGPSQGLVELPGVHRCSELLLLSD